MSEKSYFAHTLHWPDTDIQTQSCVFLKTWEALFHCLLTPMAAARSDGTESFSFLGNLVGSLIALEIFSLSSEVWNSTRICAAVCLFFFHPIQHVVCPFDKETDVFLKVWWVFFYYFLLLSFSILVLRLLLSGPWTSSISLNSAFILSVPFLVCSTFSKISLTFSS